MCTPTFHHLTWSKTEVPRHRHNLADSAAATPDLEALGLPHQAGLAKNSDRVLAELGHSLGLRLSAPSGRVLVTAGGSEANACVFGALVRPGEEVLVETPGYEPHYEAPRVFGIAVRRFTRPLGDAPDLAAAVESTLSERTRMIVVSHLLARLVDPVRRDLPRLGAGTARHPRRTGPALGRDRVAHQGVRSGRASHRLDRGERGGARAGRAAPKRLLGGSRSSERHPGAGPAPAPGSPANPRARDPGHEPGALARVSRSPPRARTVDREPGHDDVVPGGR
ncbi:MAG: aminotransferase class I/II-fold pyridoxal phosphate-dependent enzyme [Candidatus Eisenbacteria bacterium]|uniref:Aminotransferase class I/II-fold pyridoxal phosphate-dependent enzyme n=1 Tax=Eiseniibacteriota bacterium TaxID=2212470 RepID=A0A538TCK7_UNCEI|nr:MAG: aminotransferase class I/II-fold pyridoxal phosphate-dependent enzyme [Candidatus Eisenbacteria bacterium]